VDRELTDQGLARPGGGRDQDAVARLELLAGPDLEPVEVEVVEGGEVREEG
jgi:hypothetical protein